MRQPDKNKKKIVANMPAIDLSLQESDFNEAFPGRSDEYRSMEEMAKANQAGNLTTAGGWPQADLSFWSGRQYTDKQKEYMTEYTPADQTPFWSDDSNTNAMDSEALSWITGIKGVKGAKALSSYYDDILKWTKGTGQALYQGGKQIVTSPNKAGTIQKMIQAGKNSAITKGSSLIQNAKNLPTWATENLAKKLAGESVDIANMAKKKDGTLKLTARVKKLIEAGKIDPKTLQPIAGTLTATQQKVVNAAKIMLGLEVTRRTVAAGVDMAQGQGGKKYKENTWYKDDTGKKYRIVDGKKQYHEQGGFYSRAQQYTQGGMPEMSIKQMAQQGPQQLPGGMVRPIGGGAVEFLGNEHDEAGRGSDSGILLDARTEVENRETGTQVAAEGGMKDYFFSNKLKTGGMTFADKHRQLINEGAGQDQVNWLAKMQEVARGDNPNIVKAAYGGLRKRYGLAGFNIGFANNPEDAKMVDKDGDGIPDYIDADGGDGSANTPGTPSDAKKLPRFDAYPENYDAIIEAANEAGYTGKDRAKDLGEEGIARMQLSDDKGYYGDKNISSDEAREDFYNRNKDILNDMGIMKWQDFNPKEHTATFQNKFNEHLIDKYDNDDNFRAALEAKGISREEFLKSGFFGEEGELDAADNMFGERSYNATSMNMGITDIPWDGEKLNTIMDPTIFEEGDDDKSISNDKWKDSLTYAAQALPAIAALMERPDYMKDARTINPGITVAEREAKQNLDRVDYTDQLARNANDAQGVNRFIETSGGGPQNIINKMAIFAKKAQQDSAIKSAESQANTQIGNQEANINVGVLSRNAANSLRASQANAANILSANTSNVKNDMYVDEFNTAADAATKDRRLMALDSLAKGLVAMRGDSLRYKADDEYSRAVSGKTGTYERNKQKRQAREQGIEEGSAEWLKLFPEETGN
jgi:hypothetical protein